MSRLYPALIWAVTLAAHPGAELGEVAPVHRRKCWRESDLMAETDGNVCSGGLQTLQTMSASFLVLNLPFSAAAGQHLCGAHLGLFRLMQSPCTN